MPVNTIHYEKKALQFLVIDDDETIGEILTSIIAEARHTSTYFSNPLHAIDSFLNDPYQYDAVFTDLRMPQVHGDEVIAQIRNIHTNIPVFIITGTPIVAYQKQDTQHLQVSQVIAKPFDIEDIEAAIHIVEDTYAAHSASEQYKEFFLSM